MALARLCWTFLDEINGAYVEQRSQRSAFLVLSHVHSLSVLPLSDGTTANDVVSFTPVTINLLPAPKAYRKFKNFRLPSSLPSPTFSLCLSRDVQDDNLNRHQFDSKATAVIALIETVKGSAKAIALFKPEDREDSVSSPSRPSPDRFSETSTLEELSVNKNSSSSLERSESFKLSLCVSLSGSEEVKCLSSFDGDEEGEMMAVVVNVEKEGSRLDIYSVQRGLALVAQLPLSEALDNAVSWNILRAGCRQLIIYSFKQEEDDLVSSTCSVFLFDAEVPSKVTLLVSRENIRTVFPCREAGQAVCVIRDFTNARSCFEIISLPNRLGVAKSPLEAARLRRGTISAAQSVQSIDSFTASRKSWVIPVGPHIVFEAVNEGPKTLVQFRHLPTGLVFSPAEDQVKVRLDDFLEVVLPQSPRALLTSTPAVLAVVGRQVYSLDFASAAVSSVTAADLLLCKAVSQPVALPDRRVDAYLSTTSSDSEETTSVLRKLAKDLSSTQSWTSSEELRRYVESLSISPSVFVKCLQQLIAAQLIPVSDSLFNFLLEETHRSNDNSLLFQQLESLDLVSSYLRAPFAKDSHLVCALNRNMRRYLPLLLAELADSVFCDKSTSGWRRRVASLRQGLTQETFREALLVLSDWLDVRVALPDALVADSLQDIESPPTLHEIGDCLALLLDAKFEEVISFQQSSTNKDVLPLIEKIAASTLVHLRAHKTLFKVAG